MPMWSYWKEATHPQQAESASPLEFPSTLWDKSPWALPLASPLPWQSFLREGRKLAPIFQNSSLESSQNAYG